MSHDISSAYQTKFDDLIKQAYQEVGGKLRPAVHVRTGVVGTKHTFNVYGTGFAKDAPTGGADVETMGSDTTTVECVLSDKQASEYSNIFDNDKVNFDDEQELISVVAKALGRTEDQSIINALNAPTYTGTHTIAADFEVSGTNTGLTVEKLEEAVVVLDDAGIPEEDRFIVAPARAKRELLASAKATSSDYVGEVRPLVSGKVDEFLGFKFVWVADTTDAATSDTYGLPGVGTANRKCFAYHKDALALAVGNLDKQTRIDYVPQKTAHLVLAPLRAGAVVRETAGALEINIEI